MAKITIEELSDSLKEYLSGLGLTEEQVNSLVQNKLGDLSNLETVNKDNIVNSVNEVKDTVAFVGTAIFGSDMSDDTLMTDSNTVIGAINELFQSANSGKQLIASAIGNPLITGDSTFSAMSEAILELKNEGGGGSVGYATGEGSVTFIVTTESKPRNANLDKPFGFTPTHIILVFDNGAILTNKTTSNNPLELNEENYIYIDSMTSDTLTFKSFSGMNQYSHDFVYYAFDANSSSSGGSGGNSGGITSYETVLIDSADLVQSNGYYNYSIESYDLNNISLILADVKAIEDDIGFMRYYSTLLFPPSRPVGENTIYVGNYGNGETSIYEETSYTTIPIMGVTTNFIEGSLIIFYKAGAVSNSLSPLYFNSETTTYHATGYESIEFRTIDLNFVPGKFDYIAFEYYCHTNDADACNVNVVYDCNSKKCYYLIRGYYNYCYQFYDIPFNAIPIMQSDLSSPDNIDYTGYIANGASIG